MLGSILLVVYCSADESEFCSLYFPALNLHWMYMAFIIKVWNQDRSRKEVIVIKPDDDVEQKGTGLMS